MKPVVYVVHAPVVENLERTLHVWISVVDGKAGTPAHDVVPVIHRRRVYRSGIVCFVAGDISVGFKGVVIAQCSPSPDCPVVFPEQWVLPFPVCFEVVCIKWDPSVLRSVAQFPFIFLCIERAIRNADGTWQAVGWRLLPYDIDDATHGVRAVHEWCRSADDFDALDAGIQIRIGKGVAHEPHHLRSTVGENKDLRVGASSTAANTDAAGRSVTHTITQYTSFGNKHTGDHFADDAQNRWLAALKEIGFANQRDGVWDFAPERFNICRSDCDRVKIVCLHSVRLHLGGARRSDEGKSQD